MALQGCRIVCVGGTGLQQTVRHTAARMGATTRDVIDYSCTHLLSTEQEDTVKFTQCFYPWVRIVHVRWIARCWMRAKRASEREYDLAFYLAAQRTGTSTRLSCSNVFFTELGAFHAAERMVEPLSLTSLLAGKGNPRHLKVWPALCERLQGTTFWGGATRGINWRARRAVVMALARARPRRHRRRPRVASDGPAHVLVAVGNMPPDIQRAIIEYL